MGYKLILSKTLLRLHKIFYTPSRDLILAVEAITPEPQSLYLAIRNPRIADRRPQTADRKSHIADRGWRLVAGR